MPFCLDAARSEAGSDKGRFDVARFRQAMNGEAMRQMHRHFVLADPRKTQHQVVASRRQPRMGAQRSGSRPIGRSDSVPPLHRWADDPFGHRQLAVQRDGFFQVQHIGNFDGKRLTAGKLSFQVFRSALSATTDFGSGHGIGWRFVRTPSALRRPWLCPDSSSCTVCTRRVML